MIVAQPDGDVDVRQIAGTIEDMPAVMTNEHFLVSYRARREHRADMRCRSVAAPSASRVCQALLIGARQADAVARTCNRT